jgi:hypothetical protein
VTAPPPRPAFSKVESDIFADALADGDDIERAAKRAGRTALDGYRHFHRICDKLGEPARD